MMAIVLYTMIATQTPAIKPGWEKVEADNGTVYLMNTNSIIHYPNGWAEMVIYKTEGGRDDLPGLGYDPDNLRRFIFDCDGYYMDAASMMQAYAPPRSVIGRMSDVACGK